MQLAAHLAFYAIKSRSAYACASVKVRSRKEGRKEVGEEEKGVGKQ